MGMAVGPGTWVALRYKLFDGRGNLLEATEEPVEFVFGFGTVVPGLEAALEGAANGDSLNVTLAPEDAYGTRDETSVFAVERSEFPADAGIEIGTEFVAEGEDGTSMSMRVTEVHDEFVVVDGNHPLAGETLNFQVLVLGVRKATDDEVLAAQAEESGVEPPAGEPS